MSIHNPGKNKNLPRSYRQINLLLTLSKILERIMLHRMKPYLKIISLYQFDFKPLHSTCHHLQRISETVVDEFEYKKYTTTAFLDVAQVDDKVWSSRSPAKTSKMFIHKNSSFQVKIIIDISQIHPIKMESAGISS